MKLRILILTFYVYQTLAAQEDVYEYEYDEEAEHVVADGAGHRLVGAERANASKLSFLVGYKPYSYGPHIASCTGSLITRSWVVSAAHCILAILPLNETEKCVELTKKNQVYTRVIFKIKEFKIEKKQDLQCHRLSKGNLRVTSITEPVTAYIGIGDTHDKNEVVRGEKIEVDFYVRHANTYRGGGYGSYGGYDITLLHLSKPVPTKYRPSCLPGPRYKDSAIGHFYKSAARAHIAGYGRYRREPCMTDQYGPSKFHYCSNNCTHEREPPRHPVCNKFFRDQSTPHIIPEHDEELLIETRRELVGCFRTQSMEPGSQGWCKVNESAHIMGELQETISWGFCSKDCYLPHRSTEPDSSVLRKELDVDILDDALCSRYLKTSVPVGSIRFMPKILCVGHIEKPNFTVWKLKEERFYRLSTRTFKHPLTMPFIGRSDVYVRSAGTCHGDSGGPVFTWHDASRRFVTLGSVSGGRGELSNCGGMNNPTHHVRLKMFVPWIKMILGQDARDLCIIN